MEIANWIEGRNVLQMRIDVHGHKIQDSVGSNLTRDRTAVDDLTRSGMYQAINFSAPPEVHKAVGDRG
jgi:hypothetical protein